MGSGLITRGRTAVSTALLDAWYVRAKRHRRTSWQTLFIGVTGSAGKTSDQGSHLGGALLPLAGTQEPGHPQRRALGASRRARASGPTTTSA